MKPVRLVCAKAGSTLLALGVLVSSAIAGTPGKCQPDPPPDTCDHVGYCGHAGSDPNMPCFVRISETGGAAPAATVTAENVTGGPGSPDYICVHGTTEILWFTLEEPSSFKVAFGAAHPFPSTGRTTAPTFNGKKGKKKPIGKPISERVNDTDGCYQYSVQHCIGNKCTPVLDPKVIVKGGSFLTSDAAKPKPMDNK
jgi:hypothetical protein